MSELEQLREQLASERERTKQLVDALERIQLRRNGSLEWSIADAALAQWKKKLRKQLAAEREGISGMRQNNMWHGGNREQLAAERSKVKELEERLKVT